MGIDIAGSVWTAEGAARGSVRALIGVHYGRCLGGAVWALIGAGTGTERGSAGAVWGAVRALTEGRYRRCSGAVRHTGAYRGAVRALIGAGTGAERGSAGTVRGAVRALTEERRRRCSEAVPALHPRAPITHPLLPLRPRTAPVLKQRPYSAYTAYTVPILCPLRTHHSIYGVYCISDLEALFPKLRDLALGYGICIGKQSRDLV